MVIDGIPPPSRNHRTPTGPDTPASAAAASLDSPRAIAAQNRTRCSRRPTGGRPGDRIAGRPVRADALLLPLIATPLARALRRAIESAQYTSLTFTDRLDELKIDPLGRLERRRLRQRDGRSLGRDLQERARRRAPLPLLRARRARGPRLDRLLQR